MSKSCRDDSVRQVRCGCYLHQRSCLSDKEEKKMVINSNVKFANIFLEKAIDETLVVGLLIRTGP